jgi:hypothetical protein
MRLFTVSKLFFVGVIVFSLLCFPQALSAQENALHVYTGTGAPGLTNGALNQAEFYSPYGLAVNDQGLLYLADSYNNSIRVIANGVVKTVAGSNDGQDSLGFPQGGYKDGAATAAQFNRPRAVVVAPHETIYVADTQNHVIRKIADGQVTTLAGTGKAGYKNGSALEAQFDSPSGLALDQSGNLYVADTLNNAIRKIDPAGVVTTFAGSSSGNAGYQDGSIDTALFNEPAALALDKHGVLYIADTGNQLIRKASNGQVQTLAGSRGTLLTGTDYYQGSFQDGAVDKAAFNFPKGLAVLDNDHVIVADTWNSRVRAILTNGEVITLLGTGKFGRADGPVSAAVLGSPVGLAAYNNSLYIADADNNLLWKLYIDPDNLQPARAGFDPPSDQIQVWVNGSKVVFNADSQPYISEGRTMLPLRAVCEKMGWTVDWVQDGTITVIGTTRSVTFAGQDENLYNKNGTTIVGLRYLAESMGWIVDWVPDYRAVTVQE